jgi:hypothetical protein
MPQERRYVCADVDDESCGPEKKDELIQRAPTATHRSYLSLSAKTRGGITRLFGLNNAFAGSKVAK